MIGLKHSVFFRLFTLLLVSSFGLLFTADAADGDGAAKNVHSTVQHLTEKNFDDALSDAANGFWFLKFYAPWCGHCKKMAPMLEQVAPFVKGKMAIGKIDCTVEKKLCQRFSVRGYPTLKFFRDGDVYDYPAGRDADSIIEFAEKMSAEAVVFINSHEEAIEKVASKNRDGVAFVAFDPATTDADTTEVMLQSTTALQVFRQVARKMQASASFGVLGSKVGLETLEKFGVDGKDKPFVVKIEQGVDPLKYGGEINSPELLKFVEDNNVALVTKLGPHNFRSLGNMGQRLAIGVVDYEDSEKSESLISDITKYAKEGPADVRHKFRFCHIDGKKWSGFLKQFEIDTTNLPGFFILDVPLRKYWRDEEANYGIDNIRGFIDAVASDSIPSKDQNDTVGLSAYERFHVSFVKWIPWSIFLMMAFFVGVLYILTLLFLPEDEDEVLEQVSHNKADDSKKEK
mmetsp:Transcript_45726/g.138941  ORF Transcript_45726/g.138941 Transcript_45726/m.138941 type:complete len:457 (-) Transcript_45726:471-1841(-)